MIPNDNSPLIIDDRVGGTFKVNRDAFCDQKILEIEQREIFGKSWLYMGHSSELREPNAFLTRSVAGMPLIFNRDRAGEIHAWFNVCPHRGAVIERRKCGKTSGFKCFYHGWSFHNDGRSGTKDVNRSYPDDFLSGGAADLVPVPNLDQYRGFWFVNFDTDAEPLRDYLGAATDVMDLMIDQGPDGVEIISGVHEYSCKANWKLLVENSYDSYHAPETHSSYFTFLRKGLPEGKLPGPRPSAALNYGRGHAGVESEAPWARPVARWIPRFGEEAKQELEDIKAEIIARVGAERAERVFNRDRNSVIFPNFVFNDNVGLLIRTFYPRSPTEMDIQSWALGVVGESAGQRKRRLTNYLEFLGPGGFATPDDIEALELAQEGYNIRRYAPYNDISRGMLKEQPEKNDEEQMRTWWREWNHRIEGSL
jgi:p-cumate 2,3-dioxygenase alpha subunit